VTDLERLARAGVTLIGLVLAIALRRRLGRAAPFAIAAFAVLGPTELARPARCRRLARSPTATTLVAVGSALPVTAIPTGRDEAPEAPEAPSPDIAL